MDDFIILGLDGASEQLRKLLSSEPIPGLWGEKIGDDVLWNGAHAQLETGFPRKFVDLKHYDTESRLKRIVAGYAALPRPPALLTISGELNDTDAYKGLASVRGNVGLILTGPLSNWDDEFCLDKFNFTAGAWMDHVLTLAFESDMQGVTCPAWLLDDTDIKQVLEEVRKEEEFIVIATGIRSEGVPPGNHKHPRTPAFAIKHGATFVVVESEVTGLPGRGPLTQLQRIYEPFTQLAFAL